MGECQPSDVVGFENSLAFFYSIHGLPSTDARCALRHAHTHTHHGAEHHHNHGHMLTTMMIIVSQYDKSIMVDMMMTFLMMMM